MVKGPIRSGALALAVVLLLLTTGLSSALQPPAFPQHLRMPRPWLGDVEPGHWHARAPSSVPWYDRTSRDTDRDHVEDRLEGWLRTYGPATTAEVYLDYDRVPTGSDVANIEELGILILDHFAYLQLLSLSGVPLGGIEALAALPHVVFVESKPSLVPGSDVANPAVKVRGSPEYSPHTVWEELGYDGEGVALAVLDTGVDDGHESFSGKFLGGADMTKPTVPILWPKDGSDDPDDAQGHGTTCAGIALGTGGAAGTYAGNAPGAGLVDVRIGTALGFSVGGVLDAKIFDSILRAFDWAISHKDQKWTNGPPGAEGIDIITISFWGGAGDSSDGTDPYSRALDAAVEAGIVTVTIAGNAGPDNQGIASISATERGITTASSDDRNTVDRRDDGIADYSSRGPRADDGDANPYDELLPDLTAPGTDILQANYDRFGDGSSSTYGPRGSGTSYAGPNVAGVAALMLQANSNLTHDQIKEILKLTAERRGWNATDPDLDPVWNREVGYGIIDAYNATVMARDLTEVDTLDVGLQAYVLQPSDALLGNVSGLVTINGSSWDRQLRGVEGVQYHIDDGPWRNATDDSGDGTFWNWSVRVDTRHLRSGTHVVSVRAVGGGSHSLSDNVTFSSAQGPTTTTSPISVLLLPLLVVLIAVAVSLLVVQRVRKTLRARRAAKDGQAP